MKRFLYLLALIGFISCNGSLDVTITNPNVEQQFHEQPLATSQPRFSWNYETTENDVVQQNYRIIVATTNENAEKNIGDLWDSGMIPSNQMLYIPYAGKELKSRSNRENYTKINFKSFINEAYRCWKRLVSLTMVDKL